MPAPALPPRGVRGGSPKEPPHSGVWPQRVSETCPEILHSITATCHLQDLRIRPNRNTTLDRLPQPPPHSHQPHPVPPHTSVGAEEALPAARPFWPLLLCSSLACTLVKPKLASHPASPCSPGLRNTDLRKASLLSLLFATARSWLRSERKLNALSALMYGDGGTPT